MNRVDQVEYKKGININIYLDENIDMNPNEWDSNIFLIGWNERELWIKNKRFEPGRAKNIFGYLFIDPEGYEEYKEEAQKIDKEFYIFGVDAYIHSGISLSLHSEGYRCQFDTSDYIGALFVSRKEGSKEQAEKIARQELKTWNCLLNGEIYGYMIETENEEGEKDETGGCWGFIGDWETSGLIEHAKDEAEGVYKDLQKEKKDTKKKAKDKQITGRTLEDLLKDGDETIKRHALGILKKIIK